MSKLWVATRKGLFEIRNGQIANVSFLGVPVTSILARGSDVWAAVGHGHFGAKLHRSRDGGATFEEVKAPAWPPKPAVDEKDPMGRVIPWSLDQMWTLEKAGDVLWCGAVPAGLFRSADGGESWQMVRSLWDRPERKQWMGVVSDLAGIHSVRVDGRRILCGISTGGLWASEDNGETWELRGKGLWAAYMPPELKFDLNSQDIHRIAVCDAQPDVLWIQHHNGAFRSTDAGRNFVELAVPPSSFGFAVAAHPRDPQTAWFAPAVKDETRVPVDGAFVVARTRDGGKSFEVLRKGLPQKHAYHLAYRHCLDIDAAGETLALGTTTGALWTSSNQGDSWDDISRDLPPIYAVRFG